jgi:hypothetical protein
MMGTHQYDHGSRTPLPCADLPAGSAVAVAEPVVCSDAVAGAHEQYAARKDYQSVNHMIWQQIVCILCSGVYHRYMNTGSTRRRGNRSRPASARRSTCRS